MKNTLFPVVVATSLLLVTSADAAVISGPIYNPANTHSYYLLSANTWTASQAEAVTLGGHLATINNAAENAWVFSTFGGPNKALWIGLNDAITEGVFTWISGEPVTYLNWSAGEPNNAFGLYPETYTYIVEGNPGHALTPGMWNDVPNGADGVLNPVYGVVEVPEPTTATLLGLVGVVIGLCKHRIC